MKPLLLFLLFACFGCKKNDVNQSVVADNQETANFVETVKFQEKTYSLSHNFLGVWIDDSLNKEKLVDWLNTVDGLTVLEKSQYTRKGFLLLGVVKEKFSSKAEIKTLIEELLQKEGIKQVEFVYEIDEKLAVADFLIVKFNKDINSQEFENIVGNCGGKILPSSRKKLGQYHTNTQHSGGNIIELANCLEKTGSFKFIEPNFISFPKIAL